MIYLSYLNKVNLILPGIRLKSCLSVRLGHNNTPSGYSKMLFLPITTSKVVFSATLLFFPLMDKRSQISNLVICRLFCILCMLFNELTEQSSMKKDYHIFKKSN